MEKKPKLLMLLAYAEEISCMLEKGSSSVDVQAFLKEKGCEVSNKHLRINLKKIFPQYMVNGRWAPMKKRCDKELEAYWKSHSAATSPMTGETDEQMKSGSSASIDISGNKSTLPSPAADTGKDGKSSYKEDTREEEQDREGFDSTSPASLSDHNGIQPSFSRNESTSQNAPVVLATLASGVTIDSDIKGNISEEHYRLISQVYPSVANSDNAIRGVLSQSVFGREYLRMKHDALEKIKEMEK